MSRRVSLARPTLFFFSLTPSPPFVIGKINRRENCHKLEKFGPVGVVKKGFPLDTREKNLFSRLATTGLARPHRQRGQRYPLFPGKVGRIKKSNFRFKNEMDDRPNENKNRKKTIPTEPLLDLNI